MAAGSNSTGHLFTDLPACLGGVNFVTSTTPANGATGVSLSTTTLTVTFNQPMITYGGGSVLDIGNFDNNIDNLTLGGDVPILDVSYNPNTYTATLTIDTSDPQWKPARSSGCGSGTISGTPAMSNPPAGMWIFSLRPTWLSAVRSVMTWTMMAA